VQPGISVELAGSEVGEVQEAHLKYDDHHHKLLTQVTFAVDSERMNIENLKGAAGGDPRVAVRDSLKTLVAHGLRAQVISLSFLTGQKTLALDMTPNAPPAQIVQVGHNLEFPTTASGDLTEVLQSLRSVLQNIDRATSGPHLGHALQELDQTLTHLDKLTQEVEPDLSSLIKSLRDTADAAQGTLSTVQTMLGSSSNTDLPKLMRELSDAARSVRVLADYLDRHPESLLRGRKGDK
jgi:paraquat-inducible protein B